MTCMQGNGSRMRRSVSYDDGTEPESVFARVDSNGDGLLTYHEVRSYLVQHEMLPNTTIHARGPRAVHDDWYETMDANENGLIEPNEFDSSL